MERALAKRPVSSPGGSAKAPSARIKSLNRDSSHELRRRQLVRVAAWPKGPEQPVGPASLVGRESERRAGHLHPAPVHIGGLRGIDGDVAAGVAGLGTGHPHRLMPAVLAGDRIGVDRKGEVLVNAHVSPPDALCVRVARFERGYTRDAGQLPLGGLVSEDFTVAMACRWPGCPSGRQRPM